MRRERVARGRKTPHLGHFALRCFEADPGSPVHVGSFRAKVRTELPNSCSHDYDNALMSRRQPTNLASLSRGLLAWSKAQGIDGAALLNKAGLEESALEGPNSRIPAQAHLALWRAAEEAMGPARLASGAADALQPDTFGVVGVLAMTSTTVEESIARSVRFGRVLREDAVSRAYLTDTLFVVEFHLTEPAPFSTVVTSLAAYRVFMERWTGKAIHVREVCFEAPEAVNAGSHVVEHLFQCPIRFDYPVNAIVFDRATAALPLQTASPGVAEYLEKLAEEALLALERDTPDDFRREVTHAIRASVLAGAATLNDVAQRLGTSTRSLQRALRDHSLEFRQLLDEARFTLAAPLITATDLSIEEVAERLGYAESKAFRRAFQRWTGGVSPARMRRRKTA